MAKYNPVTRDSDGVTIRLDKEEAEHADQTALAKRVVRVDASGSVITGDILVITNAISEIGFDLNAAAFDQTSSISNDYTLNSIKLNFSTTESKTITVTYEKSGKRFTLSKDTNTSTDVSLEDINISFDANDHFRVEVTQFSSAGTMNCVAVVKEGSAALGGNPVLGAGTNEIGSVNIIDAADNPEVSENENFQAGDSPATIDVNTSLGRNGTQFLIWNDGPGDIKVEVSTDGSTYGGKHTMKEGEVYGITDVSVDSIRLNWISNSAYRVVYL